MLLLLFHSIFSKGKLQTFSYSFLLVWKQPDPIYNKRSETSLQLNVVNCLFPPKEESSCTILRSVATSPCNNIHSAIQLHKRQPLDCTCGMMGNRKMKIKPSTSQHWDCQESFLVIFIKTSWWFLNNVKTIKVLHMFQVNSKYYCKIKCKSGLAATTVPSCDFF